MIEDMLDNNMSVEHITNKIYRVTQEDTMQNRNYLENWMSDLGMTRVSETSLEVVGKILGEIGGLDPSENLSRAIRDWLDKTKYANWISDINFIPSDHKGTCHDLLMVVCAGEREFNLNTMEAIALCINCQSKVKTVIIVTDYWVEKEFNEWRWPPFEALYDKFGTRFFIFTPHAGRWTFNQIIQPKGKKKR